MSVQERLQGFLMKDAKKLEKFDHSIRTVLLEGGWEREDADSAVLWIKEALGLQVSVLSGV